MALPRSVATRLGQSPTRPFRVGLLHACSMSCIALTAQLRLLSCGLLGFSSKSSCNMVTANNSSCPCCSCSRPQTRQSSWPSTPYCVIASNTSSVDGLQALASLPTNQPILLIKGFSAIPAPSAWPFSTGNNTL